ncbi:hypothetical protein N7466_008936 [Penicillium verhagenii]|uniref:uncharacterized protein n=1 Tax=Penicillium verhagenii TaxID=1562060 RepID=UPI0025452E2A|nr:uncharacterized protein N7466_008936 [Penicillium verhagenii]KAJ5924749.1 hypothetical protein N7466_008936 [Penicillium verhagenii]
MDVIGSQSCSRPFGGTLFKSRAKASLPMSPAEILSLKSELLFQSLYSDTCPPRYHCNDLLQQNPRGIRGSFHSGPFQAFRSRVAQIEFERQEKHHAESLKSSVYPAQDPQDLGNAHAYNRRNPIRKCRKKSTPSVYLAESLQRAGYALGASRFSRRAAFTGPVIPGTVSRTHPNPRPRLQKILGEYIQLVEPLVQDNIKRGNRNALDIAIRGVFRESNYRYLRSRGHDAKDVAAWAWVLTSRDLLRAASRILILEADCKTQTACAEGPRVPSFITLFLLRKPRLEPYVLRLLLIHSLHLMSGEPLPTINDLEILERNTPLVGLAKTHSRLTKLDSSTCTRLVFRLIRHARLVWPEALPAIAREFSRFLTRSYLNEPQKRISDPVKTRTFNKCLWALSLPAKVHPFRSAFIQQQAQFELLRAMATHKPVIPVTRMGYRAVAAVQLAQKKTIDERQSAELKAPSWPPWKEEKLGIDAQRGNEGRYSRAMNVLSQMKEAGYSHRLWEDATAILAGWDTDGSPTVQTRALALRNRRSLSLALHDYTGNHQVLWTVRIRATRTLREAWACFLSYQDHGLPPTASIYAAMAEKLIFHQNAVRSKTDLTDHSALPGDGREVYPEPASARDIIYVRKEPPTLNDFLDEMVSQGFRASEKLLALLLQSAQDFSSGIDYLQCSVLRSDQILALCTVWHQSTDYQKHHLKALESLSDILFGSFVQFLCRYWGTTVTSFAANVFIPDQPSEESVIKHQANSPVANLAEYRAILTENLEWDDNMELDTDPDYPLTLRHAIQLVRARQPPCGLAWHNLLSALTRQDNVRRAGDRSLLAILAWHGTLSLLNWMRIHNIEIGPDDFQALCVTFYRAVDAGIKHPQKVKKAFKYLTSHSNIEDREETSFDFLIQNGLSVLKSHFDQLVLTSTKTSSIAERSIFELENKTKSSLGMPSLLHVPSYATIHSYVRAMGIVGDDDGLLHLLRWMSQSADLLNELAGDRLNGQRMIRQTLVAIRLHLEKLHPQYTTSDQILVASDYKVQEAYDIVSRTVGWEWPSNVDIQEYCTIL